MGAWALANLATRLAGAREVSREHESRTRPTIPAPPCSASRSHEWATTRSSASAPARWSAAVNHSSLISVALVGNGSSLMARQCGTSAVDVSEKVTQHLAEHGSDTSERGEQGQAREEEREPQSCLCSSAHACTHPRQDHECGSKYVGMSHQLARLSICRQHAQYPDSARRVPLRALTRAAFARIRGLVGRGW